MITLTVHNEIASQQHAKTDLIDCSLSEVQELMTQGRTRVDTASGRRTIVNENGTFVFRSDLLHCLEVLEISPQWMAYGGG